jgi:hypothetical protein
MVVAVEDISRLLPGLNRRYDVLTIVNALAEHVGYGLWYPASRGKTK